MYVTVVSLPTKEIPKLFQKYRLEFKKIVQVNKKLLKLTIKAQNQNPYFPIDPCFLEVSIIFCVFIWKCKW